jgi:hypothetical protein
LSETSEISSNHLDCRPHHHVTHQQQLQLRCAVAGKTAAILFVVFCYVFGGGG